METISVLLALYEGNSPVTGEFHSQRPVTQTCDFSWVCFHLITSSCDMPYPTQLMRVLSSYGHTQSYVNIWRKSIIHWKLKADTAVAQNCCMYPEPVLWHSFVHVQHRLCTVENAIDMATDTVHPSIPRSSLTQHNKQHENKKGRSQVLSLQWRHMDIMVPEINGNLTVCSVAWSG